MLQHEAVVYSINHIYSSLHQQHKPHGFSLGIVTNALCMCSSNLHEFSVKSKLLQLPAACLRNLEVFQNGTDGTQRGSLYWLLNHTVTRPGARLLKAWLAQPLRDVKSVTG